MMMSGMKTLILTDTDVCQALASIFKQFHRKLYGGLKGGWDLKLVPKWKIITVSNLPTTVDCDETKVAEIGGAGLMNAWSR